MINLTTPSLVEPTFTILHERAPARLVVTCVYWGDKYPVEYVHKLKAMVEKRLHIEHDFICLSDRDIEGINTKRLEMKVEGWWNKISLFMPWSFPYGARILYLDLDVVVTGDLNTLIYQWTDKALTMIYNFGPNRSHAAHNSSVMMWTHGDSRVVDIYVQFNSKVASALHGDQCWIWRVLKDDIANWPKELIQSYKYDCRGKNINPMTRVVIFHGDPKPHEVKDNFVLQNWI